MSRENRIGRAARLRAADLMEEAARHLREGSIYEANMAHYAGARLLEFATSGFTSLVTLQLAIEGEFLKSTASATDEARMKHHHAACQCVLLADELQTTEAIQPTRTVELTQ